MRFDKPKKLSDIAALLGCRYIGPSDFSVWGFNEIHRVQSGDIVFVDHPKYYDKALESAASIVLINKEVDCPQGKALLVSDDPFRDFNKLSAHFSPFIPSTAMVSETAEIGSGTVIQPGVFLGNNVKIGTGCVIYPNAVINDGCIIGNNVVIGSGTVIGGEAFYYKNRGDYFDRLLSSGNVVIEDDVEIGSNCTIDRGVSSPTTIKKGAKLDNLIHIGHDTIVGEMCLFASGVGVAGCTVIEDHVSLWGQVGVASGVTVASGTSVLAQSGVSKSLTKPGIYFGYPAEEARKYNKRLALLRMLPELLEKAGIKVSKI